MSRPDRETLPIEIKTAFEGLEEEQSRLKMTTGNSDLDSLVGGIEEGPQAVGPEGRREPQLGEIVQQVGETLITAGARG